MPFANKGAALEFRLFYGRYWAIFHIPLGNLAQFGIGAAGQIIQSVLCGLDLPAILSGIASNDLPGFQRVAAVLQE
jgi:hypothetical protein